MENTNKENKELNRRIFLLRKLNYAIKTKDYESCVDLNSELIKM